MSAFGTKQTLMNSHYRSKVVIQKNHLSSVFWRPRLFHHEHDIQFRLES